MIYFSLRATIYEMVKKDKCKFFRNHNWSTNGDTTKFLCCICKTMIRQQFHFFLMSALWPDKGLQNIFMYPFSLIIQNGTIYFLLEVWMINYIISDEIYFWNRVKLSCLLLIFIVIFIFFLLTLLKIFSTVKLWKFAICSNCYMVKISKYKILTYFWSYD